MKAWRPYWPGTCVIELRGDTRVRKSGLVLQKGLQKSVRTDEKWQAVDLEKYTKMIADVTATFGTRQVDPGDAVIFEPGQEIAVRDHSGQEIVLIHEKYCMVKR